MTTAVQVNPYATDEFAAPIKSAIEMSREERQRRMHKMREVVAENNIYKWAADLMSALAKFEFGTGS